MLDLLNDPEDWFNRTQQARPEFGISSSRRALINAAMPALASEGDEVTDRFYADLTSGGLIKGGGLNTMMSAGGAWQPISKVYGERFMAFLIDPR